MKNKILILLLIPLTILVSACGNTKGQKQDNTKTITITDINKKVETKFTYEKKLGFSEVNVYKNDGSPTIEFDNVSLDIDFEMYFMELATDTYEQTKENRKGKKFYKEYMFGKYDSYIYADYENNCTMNIQLKSNKKDNTTIILVITMDRLDDDENVVIADLIERKEMQDFFNSIEFDEIEK